jgi:hypothetical protein
MPPTKEKGERSLQSRQLIARAFRADLSFFPLADSGVDDQFHALT